jgi:hypothetical protein
MELTLTKVRTYKLEPFGKFVTKWKSGKNVTPNTIPISELSFHYDTEMPMTEEQDKEVIQLMKKHQTDILTDGNAYYTRSKFGNDVVLIEVDHYKFHSYKHNIGGFADAVNNGHSFGRRKISVK